MNFIIVIARIKVNGLSCPLFQSDLDKLSFGIIPYAWLNPLDPKIGDFAINAASILGFDITVGEWSLEPMYDHLMGYDQW